MDELVQESGRSIRLTSEQRRPLLASAPALLSHAEAESWDRLRLPRTGRRLLAFFLQPGGRAQWGLRQVPVWLPFHS